MELADWAEDTARTILQVPLPRRWAHTQGVAAQARTLKPILGKNTDLLVAAAWLHDIGYAPDLVDTGFHPLDGARFLSDLPRPAICCAAWWRIIRARLSRPPCVVLMVLCARSSSRSAASWPRR